jgi:hypothetical protein
MHTLKALGKNLFRVFLYLSIWWLPAVFGIPWFMAAAPQPLCLCLHFHMALSLDVHLFSPSHKDTGYIGVKAHYTLV